MSIMYIEELGREIDTDFVDSKQIQEMIEQEKEERAYANAIQQRELEREKRETMRFTERDYYSGHRYY